MKIVIMIIACIIVAVSQTFILLGFLKKLKKIEADFWGTAEKKARDEIHKAREDVIKHPGQEETAKN